MGFGMETVYALPALSGLPGARRQLQDINDLGDLLRAIPPSAFHGVQRIAEALRAPRSGPRPWPRRWPSGSLIVKQGGKRSWSVGRHPAALTAKVL